MEKPRKQQFIQLNFTSKLTATKTLINLDIALMHQSNLTAIAHLSGSISPSAHAGTASWTLFAKNVQARFVRHYSTP
jgi:hypothetical protein